MFYCVIENFWRDFKIDFWCRELVSLYIYVLYLLCIFGVNCILFFFVLLKFVRYFMSRDKRRNSLTKNNTLGAQTRNKLKLAAKELEIAKMAVEQNQTTLS